MTIKQQKKTLTTLIITKPKNKIYIYSEVSVNIYCILERVRVREREIQS